MTRPPITAIAVGIPARDEAPTVAACIGSVLRAIDVAGMPAAIVVAADSCTDRTAAIARNHLDAAGVRADVIDTSCGTAGGARQLACGRALGLLGHPLETTWLATTDADSTVPPTWLSDHLARASGCDGVAGLVELDDTATDRLHRRLIRLQTRLGVGPGHPHVHGANLGVRAAAWHAVGGFPAVATGEDNALWAALLRAEATLVAVDGHRVRTSPRTEGRAPDGFASVLSSLADTRSTHDSRSKTQPPPTALTKGHHGTGPAPRVNRRPRTPRSR